MKARALKKSMKGIISILLVLSVLAGLLVPFNITAFADEEPARGSEIYAMLYKYADAAGNPVSDRFELVFQRGNTPDPSKVLVKSYENFADSTSNSPWYTENYPSKILSVNIKDKIAPKSMVRWFTNMSNLKSENITNLKNIDTTQCTNLTNLFSGDTALTSLDLKGWTFPLASTADSIFQNCKNLTSLDISTWELPKAYRVYSMFSGCSSIETIDISSFNMKNAGLMTHMFYGCSNLKSVNLGEMSTNQAVQFIYFFRDCSSLEEVDLSGWNVPNPGIFFEMFSGCTSLKNVNFGSSDHWGKTPSFWSYNGRTEQAYEKMFANCTSLESLDLTCVKGALLSSSTFQGCTNLKEINLEYAGTGKENRDGYDKNLPAQPDLTGKSNIFEECNELSWIKLSADGWPADGKAGASVPPKSSWKKIDEPNKDLRLPADQLFQHFQSDYAGTWVADSFITFKGNGGTPAFQTVDGFRGLELNFDEKEIVAERNGYDFDGWWTEPTGGTQLHSGDIAEQWSYYAHWIPHKYNLVLDGNGGTVPEDYSVEGGEISADRKTITFKNLSYPDFQELSKQMFAKNDDSVLASWNTRKNGKGTSYYVNDSVNKLTEADGATATLFAQWHKPEAVISFNSEGGTEVNSREYKVGDTYGTLPVTYRAGYTFDGWYTEPNEYGVATQITSGDEVIGSQTLHAKWEKNPVITFNANGGKIHGESTTTKVCGYGYKIGSLPVPDNGSATLKGWFTQAEGGTQITGDTTVTSDNEYFAQWGWQPKFETNGGSFSDYPEGGYEISGDYRYTINFLPEVKKSRSEFEGWYFGDHKVEAGDTLDLSESNVITARWKDTPQYTVTFKYENGAADEAVKVYSGNGVGQLPSPKRGGYDFDGWYDSNGVKYTADSPVIESDVTLYAHWTAQDRTVRFDPCGGTMVDSDAVKVVNGRTLPSLPGANYLNSDGDIEKRFGGWYTEPNGQGTLLTTDTPITEDKTYYAYWLDIKTQADDDYVHSIHWATISNTEVTNTGGHLVFHPSVKGDINARLYISLEKPGGGTLDLPANSLRITIPAHLFEGEGEENNLDVFFKASDDDDIKAEYSQDRKSIILTNPSRITKNTILTPEFNISPQALKGGYIDENGYYKGDYYVKHFDVKIDIDQVVEGDRVLAEERHYSRSMGLEVHTGANTTVSKARADVALNWSTEWGKAPADAKEYFYVIWSLTSDNRNCNQPYQLKWSEDTSHDGTVVYSNPKLDDWSSIYTNDGTHTTKVVTKHRRADVNNTGDEWAKVYNEAILNVKWNDEYEEQFRASCIAEVYVPIISDGDFTFGKSIPNFSDQNKHTVNGGQELILNGEPEQMPLPYNISYAENVNTDNPVWNPASETYKTTPRTIVIEDGAQGDVMLSTDYGASSRTWDSQYIKPLNQSDYYFSKLDITLTENDAVYLDGKWSNTFVNSNVSNYGDIIVYAKIAGSDKLELVTTLRGVNSASVTLPKNTVYFKVEHTSDYFSTNLSVNPTLYLTDSNRVRELISNDVADKRDTIVANKCRITATRENGEPVVTESSKDGAWRSMYLLNISSSTLYAAKKCSTADYVDRQSTTEEFPVVISGWNYNNSVRNFKKYLKSGVFNDLLPVNCTVDKDSVFVRPRTDNATTQPESPNLANDYNKQIKKTDLLPEGYYSVTFKDNWQDSGRTMMTVTVNSPEGKKYTGFNVFYKMKTTYSNININGINLINSVSFTDTTNGQSAPDMRSGVRTILDSKSRSYYTSIDSPQTAYATDKTNLIQPPKYQYGADLNVRAEGSVYTKHETVGLNTDYNYNTSYTGGDTSKTSDIVIYDVIERQIDGPVSEWHGSFDSIDVSSIRNLKSAAGNGNCNPIVYYSTKPKADFTEDDFDITKSDIWTTVKPDNELITAVAVDCRSTDSGGNFVLNAKNYIGFNINMHSPVSKDKSGLETYNEAVIKGKIEVLNERITSKARTTVTLRFTNPRLEKSAFPESGTSEKPESVVKGSVLEYVLKLTNPDEELEMTNIVVEDIFSNTMKFNNTIMVKLGEGENIPVNQAARISSYSVNENASEGKTTFTATVSSLAPGETIAITIPVTVTDEIGTKISNKAKVTHINGIKYDVESNETFHKVTDIQGKVLKVNGKGNPLKGAVLQILDENKNVMNLIGENGETFNEFTSTEEVIRFSLNPGTYYVHEKSAPEDYKATDDIQFSIDDEGIITVKGEDVSYVAVTDKPDYKVIFHENKPGGSDDEVQEEFRIYEPNELNDDKSITHFYDIPEWAEDKYVFAGWYHDSGYTQIASAGVNDSASIPAIFEDDKYIARDSDYHLYAKWIAVGTVNKDIEDDNIVADDKYRGFGLAGVQIREPHMKDSNYNNEETPGGMRFVSSISEDLLRQIDEVSDIQVKTGEGYLENVEYGYVAAAKQNVDAFVNRYGAVPSEYSLQYRGENVNGVNTLGTDENNRSAKTDYRYIDNVNCTSSHPINGKTNGEPYVKDDHRNYGEYRLFTLVITYEGEDVSSLGEGVDARAYIRYYDANRKLRVFYNNYNNTKYYGGCMCSYNQVSEMALPKKTS